MRAPTLGAVPLLAFGLASCTLAGPRPGVDAEVAVDRFDGAPLGFGQAHADPSRLCAMRPDSNRQARRRLQPGAI